jgi:hypothetical protein
MSTATVSPKLRRLVRDLGRIVILRLAGAGAKWTPIQYEDALDEELARVDLNRIDFRRDIVRTFVRADLAERAKVDPFTTNADGHLAPELFDSSVFARGVIRLGNGFNVRMSDASAQEWIARQLHQQRAAETAQQAATKTTRFLQTPPGVLLLENPRLKTADAMRQMHLWAEDDPIVEPADSDDESSDNE